MSENENYEIRIYLIGDPLVGKNSIAQRFLKLNTSKTVEDNFFLKKNPKELYKKSNNDKYKQMSNEKKLEIRKEVQRLEVQKTAKEISINGFNIILNFFPICEAEKLENLKEEHLAKEEEEDYEFEQYYRISLRKMRNQLYNNLTKQKKYENSIIEHIFLFIFDLNDFITFERLEIYYYQLEKYFQISDNFKKALIGNKLDIKSFLKKPQQKRLDDFISNNNFNFYEISTRMFFNFEKFFEKLFFDLLGGLNENFSKENFKSRFNLLINKRPNFSKAERSSFKFSDTPGPDTYQNDVYDYPKDEKIFHNTFYNGKNGRFVTKIFIGKEGPIFPIINNNLKNNGKKKDDIKNKTAIGFGNWDSKNKKEIKDALETNIPGYSLGIKTAGNFHLREKRKLESQNRNMELFNALTDANNFDNNNNLMTLHIKKPPKIKNKNDFDIYAENKKENLKELAEIVKEKEDDGFKRRNKILKENENKNKKRLQKIRDKQNKYQKIYEEKEMNKTQTSLYHPPYKRSKTPSINTTNANKLSSNDHNIFSNTLYDIRTKYDPNKGWTFGSKLTYNPFKSKDDPDFANIKSDFDKIVQNPKHKSMYSAPRFKDTIKINIGPIQTNDDELNEKIKRAKEKGERAKILQNFLTTRQKDLERVKQNKINNENENEKKIIELIETIPRANYDEDYYLSNINYNLVENKSPNFTMGMKLTHGSIFDDKNNNNMNDINNIDEEELGKNGKPVQDENYIKNLPVPRYDFAKANLGGKGFRFGTSKRFYIKKDYNKNNKNFNDDYVPFSDGKFVPDDKKDFSSGNFMGYGDRGNFNAGNSKLYDDCYKFYKIKGFADIIVEQGMKIAPVRERIFKERYLREMKKNGMLKDLDDKNDKNKNKKNMDLNLNDNDDDYDYQRNEDNRENINNDNNIDNNNNNENINENNNSNHNNDNNINNNIMINNNNENNNNNNENNINNNNDNNNNDNNHNINIDNNDNNNHENNNINDHN